MITSFETLKVDIKIQIQELLKTSIVVKRKKITPRNITVSQSKVLKKSHPDNKDIIFKGKEIKLTAMSPKKLLIQKEMGWNIYRAEK